MRNIWHDFVHISLHDRKCINQKKIRPNFCFCCWGATRIGHVMCTVYIAHRHGILIHMYAGVTWLSFDDTDMERRLDVSVQLENCFTDLQS